MKDIKIFIADDQYLVLEGLRKLISENCGMCFCGYSDSRAGLIEKFSEAQPDVMITDYTSSACSLSDIALLKTTFSNTSILAITPHQAKREIRAALDAGVTSHILKDCGRDEIIDAIHSTANSEKFFCGKVVETLLAKGKQNSTSLSSSCEALNISDRELEIIRLIAEGCSNRQVAERLFLSQHTINTHRKNIMAKLGVNNTAGIVLFAVKERIVKPDNFLFN